MSANNPRIKPFLITLLFFCVAGAVAFFVFYPYITDDGLISLQYSRRFLQGKGLSWSDAIPRVEGYSNLTWVLLNAFSGWLGADLITSVRLWGVLLTAGMFFLLYQYYPRENFMGFLLANALLAFSSPITLYMIAGLEQPAEAFFLMAGFFFLFRAGDDPLKENRYLITSGIFWGLALLTRPDVPLFFGVALLITAWGVESSQRKKIISHTVLIAGLFLVGQMAFRLMYYGDWIPNTARVKLALSAERIQDGWNYISDGIMYSAPLFWICLYDLYKLIRGKSAGKWERANAILFILWMGYLLFSGGDIFPSFRQFVPVIVILAGRICWGEPLFGGSLNRRMQYAMIVPAIAYFSLQFNERTLRSQTEIWEWKGMFVARHFSKAFSQNYFPLQERNKPLLAFSAAGCMSYWSDLDGLDYLGLNDPWLPKHKPKAFGEGAPGHELSDPEYVLRQKPDAFFFCQPMGLDYACFPAEADLLLHPEFGNEYRLVEMRIPVETSPFMKDVPVKWVWKGGLHAERVIVQDIPIKTFVRYRSPWMGMPIERDSALIPSWFFRSNDGRVSQPDNQLEGKFSLRLEPGDTSECKMTWLPEGKWEIRTDPNDLDVQVDFLLGENDLTNGSRQFSLDSFATGPVVRIRNTADTPSAFLHVRLIRIPPLNAQEER